MSAFSEIDGNTIVLAFFKEHFLSIIDRVKQKELKLVMIPGFCGNLWIMKEMLFPSKKKQLFLKDDKHIYQFDVTSGEIFPILKSNCNGGCRRNLDVKLASYGKLSIAELEYQFD